MLSRAAGAHAEHEKMGKLSRACLHQCSIRGGINIDHLSNFHFHFSRWQNRPTLKAAEPTGTEQSPPFSWGNPTRKPSWASNRRLYDLPRPELSCPAPQELERAWRFLPLACHTRPASVKSRRPSPRMLHRIESTRQRCITALLSLSCAQTASQRMAKILVA